MAPDLPHDEPQQEDNLLVEAVSLLVQRQRETEAWVSEQIDHAEERAASVERRYSELESRLGGLEEQLDRLTRDFEVNRGDSAVDQRLARLREQVADLKSETVESRPPRPIAPVVRSAEPEPVAPPTVAVAESRNASSVWDVVGRTPRDRFGLLAMFVGFVAVLYAALSQLRF